MKCDVSTVSKDEWLNWLESLKVSEIDSEPPIAIGTVIDYESSYRFCENVETPGFMKEPVALTLHNGELVALAAKSRSIESLDEFVAYVNNNPGKVYPYMFISREIKYSDDSVKSQLVVRFGEID